jgi:hypothetical protein
MPLGLQGAFLEVRERSYGLLANSRLPEDDLDVSGVWCPIHTSHPHEEAI